MQRITQHIPACAPKRADSPPPVKRRYQLRGCKGYFDKFTSGEIEIVKKLWPTKSGREIGEIIGRPRGSVIRVASDLGLKKAISRTATPQLLLCKDCRHFLPDGDKPPLCGRNQNPVTGEATAICGDERLGMTGCTRDALYWEPHT